MDIYRRHGPLLRCVAEAADGDEQIRANYELMRSRFDDFAEVSLRGVADLGNQPHRQTCARPRARST